VSSRTAPSLDLALVMDPGPGAALAASTQTALADPSHAEGLWAAHLGSWLAQLGPELPGHLQADGYSLGLELCGDDAIAQLNQSWRQQAGPTDVLAFAAQEGAPPLPPQALAMAPVGGGEAGLELGDIVISLETAQRQAQEAGHSLDEELLFLASHGLLHLLGWDHPDEGSLAAMLERQRRLLLAPAA
jgi:probable rRNA maturation factor